MLLEKLPTGFVLKIRYDTDKSDLEKKIPDSSGRVKKIDHNAKITEIGSEISSISGLASNAALTVVDNKIPNISSLVKKTNYNVKVNEIGKKNLFIIIVINILLLQNLISFQQKFLMQD